MPVKKLQLLRANLTGKLNVQEMWHSVVKSIFLYSLHLIFDKLSKHPGRAHVNMNPRTTAAVNFTPF